jgi:lipoprotein Spr
LKLVHILWKIFSIFVEPPVQVTKENLMSRHILFAATILFFCLGAATPALAQKKKQATKTAAKTDVKFLDDITIQASSDQNDALDPKAQFSKTLFTSERKSVGTSVNESTIENASSLQLKYALLLDVEVEQALSLNLFKVLDEWLGTRYRWGGTTKDGIDCSAFMQVLFTTVYGISLPRTARDQYEFCRKISRTELQEGDLIFFNTIGGVSHVGMYLQNNKFVHASTSGVTISDLYDEYWMKRFVGVGRADQQQTSTALTIKP